MKLGMFTDPHYSSAEVTCGVRYNSRSLEKIKKAYEYFEKENCDLVICLGDLIDHEDSHERVVENLKAVAGVINSSPIPSVCLMGNHDAFTMTPEEFYSVLGRPEPGVIEKEGKTLVFLDACHSKTGAHYVPGDVDWTDTFYPHTEELKALLNRAEGEVFVFLHQNVDPDIQENHRLFNTQEMNAIFAASGKVKTVYQGHYHHGNRSVHNGISYITFPAMCENTNAVFIEEI
ncbi:MAG: metallophosphoesterase [Clostridia bacterium]|nr:metallophosphoesterase [Clostridia bacterium]